MPCINILFHWKIPKRTDFNVRFIPLFDFVVCRKRLVLGDILVQKQNVNDLDDDLNLIPKEGVRDENQKDPVLLIERKRVDDLMASAFDGRLADQKKRLQQWQDSKVFSRQKLLEIAKQKPFLVEPNYRWVIYLIEGVASPQMFHHQFVQDPDARYRLLLKIILQQHLDCSASGSTKRHLCIRSSNLMESSYFLLTLFRTISTWSSLIVDSNSVSPSYVPQNFRKTNSDVYIRQLCCTYGMSAKRAEEIKNHFPNLVLLQSALQNPSQCSVIHGILKNKSLFGRLCQDLGISLPAAGPPKKRIRPAFRMRKKHRHDGVYKQNCEKEEPHCFPDISVGAVHGSNESKHTQNNDTQPN